MKAGSPLLVWLLFINVSSSVTGNELDKKGGREGKRELVKEQTSECWSIGH